MAGGLFGGRGGHNEPAPQEVPRPKATHTGVAQVIRWPEYGGTGVFLGTDGKVYLGERPDQFGVPQKDWKFTVAVDGIPLPRSKP